MAASDTPRPKPSGVLTFIWALFFFFVFAFVVLVWVRASGARETVEEKRSAARLAKLTELEKSENAKLAAAGWVDQPKGVVHIPIADAKRLIMGELRAKKPVASAVKVEPPLPLPPPADPNSAEPPPPALPSAPQGADMVRFDLPVAAQAAPAAPAAPPQSVPPAAPPAPASVAPPGATSAQGVAPTAAPPAPAAPASALPDAPAPARPALINPTPAQ